MRITIALIIVAAALPARADRRTLIRAYEYATQPKGNLEVEIWNELEQPTEGEIADSVITQRIELEYGLTDHWDVALYHVFESGGPVDAVTGARPAFHFDSWRAETRYRFAEKNEWPVDVMVYLELERPAALEEAFELEEKLILEKSIGARFALVGNIVGEQKLFHAAQGHLLELDLGARYEVAPALRLGLESWFIKETVSGLTSTQLMAGPSISVATERFWLQLGAGFAVGVGSPDNESSMFVRSVLGFNL